jgi:hypothetical protein
LRVGINYPWLHCGWDFGPEPPSYGPRIARAELRADLTRLAQAGVTIVRWFVLADGFSYGVGEQAPQRDRRGFRFDSEARLAPSFIEDFVSLLALCAELGLQLLPVLLDHQFAFLGLDRHSEDARTLALWQRAPESSERGSLRLTRARERAARLPAGYVKGGRADVIADARVTQRFLDNVLAPLVGASRRHMEAVYAWELINEPEWIMRRLPFASTFRMPVEVVCRFMQTGLSAIRDHGFTATVGFARARTLRALLGKLPALDLNQVHYYPRWRLARLADARFANGRPSVLGEFATRSDQLGAWPDLPSSRQEIARRLALAQRKGYDAALLWSFRGRDRATLEDRAEIERQITRYVRA